MKFVAVVALFAVVTYLVIRLIERRSELMGLARGRTGSRPTRPTRPARPSRPSKPVAPDDDEDFLRELDRKRLNPEDPDQQ